MLNKIIRILTQKRFQRKQFKHMYMKPIDIEEPIGSILDKDENIKENIKDRIETNSNENVVTKYERVEGELLSSFRHIFQDDKGRELYILEEKESMFTDRDLDRFHKEISGFITLSSNDVIKYNINLILLCPFGKSLADKNIINKYENNKYICRKIFLNTLNDNLEEEINLLPLLRLNSNPIAIDEYEIKNSVIGILSNSADFYEELKKDIKIIDINKIKELLLTFSEEGDDRE